MNALQKSAHEQIDTLQKFMQDLPTVFVNEVIHLFTPGLYIREIFMPANTVTISKVHKTCHPFVVSMGVVKVFNAEDGEAMLIEAPHTNITKPGTRRVLHILADTIWTTFHSLEFITGDENTWNDEEKAALIAKIEDILIQKQ